MFRKTLLIQYTFILTVGFISGVICFQAFSMDKAVTLIRLIDPRLIHLQEITIWHTIIPLVIWMIIVLVFATHQYLYVIAPLIVAVKATFFGFSSVFLLTQQQSILFYSVWWYPFQLIYCILLFMLASVHVSRKIGPNRKNYFLRRLFTMTLILFTIFCIGEIIAISYIIN